MRDERKTNTSAATHASYVADTYWRYVEEVTDDYLRRMNVADVHAHLARKQDELATTFIRCPNWAAERLPALALVALRLEFARSLGLTPVTAFSPDTSPERGRAATRSRTRSAAFTGAKR